MDYLVLFLAVLLPVAMVDLARGRLTPGVMEAVSGFTGAFVLGVIVFHMLPEAYGGAHSAAGVGGCVLAGLLLQTVLEFFSRGIDHGHTHSRSASHGEDRAHTADGSLTIGMFVSLFLHTFLESTPIVAGDAHGHGHLHEVAAEGSLSPLLVSIALHTIPMAIVLYMMLLRTVKSRTRAWLLMILFALSGPLGILAGAHWEFIHRYYYAALAVVVGILLHVSSVMMSDCQIGFHGRLRKLGVIALGFAAAAWIAL